MSKVDKGVFDIMLGRHHTQKPSMADFSAVTDATNMFGDFDGVFDMFLHSGNVAFLAQEHGLKMKTKHSIVRPWPLRVTDASTKEEFDVARASRNVGFERYVEIDRSE
jgi:hypothetical protein